MVCGERRHESQRKSHLGGEWDETEETERLWLVIRPWKPAQGELEILRVGEEPAVWFQKDSEEKADLSAIYACSWDHLTGKCFPEAAAAIQGE
jgi:hypothetical protein